MQTPTLARRAAMPAIFLLAQSSKAKSSTMRLFGNDMYLVAAANLLVYAYKREVGVS